MPALPRTILIWLIASAYATVVAGGSCWHGLTEARHAEDSAATGVASWSAADGSAASSNHGDHCPVCHHLTQSQLLPSPIPRVEHSASSPTAPVVLAARPTPPQHSPACPRAPPAA